MSTYVTKYYTCPYTVTTNSTITTSDINNCIITNSVVVNCILTDTIITNSTITSCIISKSTVIESTLSSSAADNSTITTSTFSNVTSNNFNATGLSMTNATLGYETKKENMKAIESKAEDAVLIPYESSKEIQAKSDKDWANWTWSTQYKRWFRYRKTSKDKGEYEWAPAPKEEDGTT